MPAALALAVGLAFTVLETPALFAPDDLARSHNYIGECTTCHSGATSVRFHAEQASDRACQVCHTTVPHHTTDSKARGKYHRQSKVNAIQCRSCHQVHTRQSRVAYRGTEAGCVRCHGFRKFSRPEKQAATKTQATGEPKVNVPQWMARFLPGRKKQTQTRVTALKKLHPSFAPRKRPRPLKFNHRFHARRLDAGFYRKKDRAFATRAFGESKNGLACSYCHKFAPGANEPQRVSYKNSCKACHQRDLLRGLDHERLTARLGGQRHPAFRRCASCHTVKGRRISPSRTRRSAFVRGRFEHRAHLRRMDCQQCHKDTANSRRIPARFAPPASKTCGDCHNGSEAFDSCVRCHSYHRGRHKIQRQPKGGR